MLTIKGFCHPASAYTTHAKGKILKIGCVLLCVYVCCGYFFYLGGICSTRYAQHATEDTSYSARYIGLVCAKGISAGEK